MKTKVFKALVLFLIVTSMAIQETKAMSLLDNSILYQVETIASSFSHPPRLRKSYSIHTSTNL